MKKKILTAVVVALLAFSSVPVMAANSPTAAPVYSVTVDKGTVSKDGNSGIKVNGGKISVSTGTVEVGKTVTFKATANKGKKFSKWIINGSYTIVSGSLTSGTITVIPNGDIDINAKFVNKNSNPEKETTKGKDKTVPYDGSTTSPKTGAAAGAIVITLLASGGIAITSKKKFSK